MPNQSLEQQSTNKPPTLTRPVLVRLTPDMYAEVAGAAEDMGAPVAIWMRRALKRQLAAEGREASR